MSLPSQSFVSLSSDLWAKAAWQWPAGCALVNAQGQVLQANPALSTLLGAHDASSIGQPLTELLALQGQEVESWQQLLAGARQSLEMDFLLAPAIGSSRWVAMVALPLQDAAPVAYVVHLQDIDARKQTEASQGELVSSLYAMSGELRRELRHVGTHDALTGLPNRASFELQLVSLVGKVRAGAAAESLVFLDLDRFQIINDTAGHAAGDALLRQVAQRLCTAVLPGSRVARLGGDEFAVLMPCGLDRAEDWVTRMLVTLAAEPFVWQGRSYAVAASAGVAAVTAETDTVSQLMGQADVACYAAKVSGRNRVCVYRPEALETLERHRELKVVSVLREVLDSNRCVLYAQRIEAAEGDLGQRFEILVRMLDDDGNLLPPTSFIPAAEHYDLMDIVDRWVFETVLLQYGAVLAGLPNVVLHLNVSANSLNTRDFLASTLALLKGSPVAPERLVFEITETAVIGNLDQAAQVIQALRDFGCGIALDDFGIGLSSFGYLRKFPVDFVKIDGSFVHSMPNSMVDRRIVGAIHDIAQVLGAQTIAESVESPEIFAMVRAMGIHFGQGFGLHRPEPLADVLKNLNQS